MEWTRWYACNQRTCMVALHASMRDRRLWWSCRKSLLVRWRTSHIFNLVASDRWRDSVCIPLTTKRWGRMPILDPPGKQGDVCPISHVVSNGQRSLPSSPRNVSRNIAGALHIDRMFNVDPIYDAKRNRWVCVLVPCLASLAMDTSCNKTGAIAHWRNV